ncbi:hypothetical protein [Aeromonas veronii]|uniref:hypothetical protein n=1 Tax=Aeromonas veronii TaxID=654 RepID=UPI003D20327B
MKRNFKSTWPHKDFLVSNSHANNEFDILYGPPKQAAETKNIFCWPDNSCFSGYYFDGPHLKLDNENFFDLNGRTGSFTSVVIFNSTVKACTDIFGMSRLYLCYADENAWALTNNYEMGINWLSTKSGNCINDQFFIRSLMQPHQVFSQRHTRYSDINGIRLISLDEKVEIVDGKVNIIKNEHFELLLNESRFSYDELIDKATIEIKDNITAIEKSGLFDDFVTDLSGGIDSRLVLSSATHIKDYSSRIKIRTIDVKNSPDLQISNIISDALGLKYLSYDYSDQNFMTVESAYNSAVSYFLGEYHTYGFPAWSNMGANNRVCRLSGGCGELYRAVNLKKGNIAFGNSMDFSKNADKPYLGINIFNNKTASDTLEDEINLLPGNRDKQSELHYIYYRNRLHYGMRSWDNYHDMPVFHPVVSKYLFMAAMKLTPEERAREKAMLDMTHSLNPLLPLFPYATKAEIDLDLMSHRASSNSKITIEGCGDVTRWEKATQEMIASRQMKRRKISEAEAKSWANVNSYIFERALSNLDYIKNNSASLNTALNSIDVNILKKAQQTSPSFFRGLAGRLESFRYQLELFS